MTEANVNRQISYEMIAAALDRDEYNYLRDKAGDFLIQFSYDESWRSALRFWVCLEGEEKAILAFRTYSDYRIPRDDWPAALQLCNEWHEKMRWPFARLFVENAEHGNTGTIVLEYHVDVGTGTTQAFVESVIASILSSSMRFWSWAVEEKHF